MKVDIGRAQGFADTPASIMVEYVVEHVTALMSIVGIESISTQQYSAGFGTYPLVSIKSFDDVPSEIRTQGVVIKDALAKILAVANISKIAMKCQDQELKDMQAVWRAAVDKLLGINDGGESAAAVGAAIVQDPSEIQIVEAPKRDTRKWGKKPKHSKASSEVLK